MASKDIFHAHTHSAEQVAQALNVDVSTGLSTASVEERRQKYGFNELSKEPGTPLWKLVLEQFDDMLVKVGGVLLSCQALLLPYHFDSRFDPVALLYHYVGVWQWRFGKGWCSTL